MFNDALVPEIPDIDCHVCMLPHNDEIHAATLNLRQWFRGEVTKYFSEEDEEMYLLIDEEEEALLVA